MSLEGIDQDDACRLSFVLIWAVITLTLWPFGIFLFITGILVFLHVLKQEEMKTTGGPADTSQETATGERPAIVKVDRRIIYQVPRKCPECGGSLSNEEVDWVGPLQAKCPFCRTTVEAVPAEF